MEHDNHGKFFTKCSWTVLYEFRLILNPESVMFEITIPVLDKMKAVEILFVVIQRAIVEE